MDELDDYFPNNVSPLRPVVKIHKEPSVGHDENSDSYAQENDGADQSDDADKADYL